MVGVSKSTESPHDACRDPRHLPLLHGSRRADVSRLLPRRARFRDHLPGARAADIFFGIVRRGGAQILMKAVGVAPVPNCTRDIEQGIARWDAYVDVPDPDALAAEYASRNVEFFVPLMDTEDGLRGFELKDSDGYI